MSKLLGKVLKVSYFSPYTHTLLISLHLLCIPLIYRVLSFCVSWSPCPSKTEHRTRPSSDRVIPSNVWILFHFSPNDDRWVFFFFFFSFFSGVKHGWTQHQTLAPAHHIAKSFPTQLTQLTISCISVRRLSLHVFDFSE
jgi:hypothetical protein